MVSFGAEVGDKTKTKKTPSVGLTLLSSVYAKCHAFVF